jgi:hypothetical protein
MIRPPTPSALGPERIAAIAAVMHLLVEDDLAHGISPLASMHCAACRWTRPAPGFIVYGDYRLCNACATEYETRRAAGVVQSINAHVAEMHARLG